MKRGDFRRFGNQFQRFGSALIGYMLDAFRYDWKLASWTVGTSMAGISLQAASLGAVLLVARSYEDAIRSGAVPAVDVPLIPGIPPSFALGGVVVLLVLSVFLLYESERAMYTLSVRFANWRASALLTDYPLVAERIDAVGVDGPSGVPAGLGAEMSRRAMALSRAGRTLFGGGMALMQFIYGTLFLLYLQPLLALLVVAVAAPLVIPLRGFTRQVNEAEKGRTALQGNIRNDLARIVQEKAGAVPGSRAACRLTVAQYGATKTGRSNEFILARFIGMARSKAVANAGLTLTVAVTIAVFFGLYGPEEISISSMLVFFVALRVAAMGGRQLVARIARFARFYGPVRLYLLAYHEGRHRCFPQNAILGVTAPDAEDGAWVTRVLERGVPFGVFGAFPLAPLNLHMLGVFADADAMMTRGDLAAGTTYVPPAPRIGDADTWRDWLRLPAGTDYAALFRTASLTCPAGAAPPIDAKPDSPVKSTSSLNDGGYSDMDLAMLAAWSAPADVIVVPSEAIDHLGESRWREWRKTLADRYLLVYYQAGSGAPCRAGEDYAAMIDFAGSAVGVATAAWLRENADTAAAWVATGTETVSSASADDDEDDDD